jgi:anti-repressor protein
MNFNYKGTQVRTIDKDGEPWFVLKDVCDVLDLGTPARVAERLDGDEVSLTHITDSIGRQQETTIINESGLYNVILRSDKPQAKPFRKWVTNEVLPSIRKHGAYVTPAKLEDIMNDPDAWIKMLTTIKDERTARIAAEATVAEQAPKVLFADSVAGSKDCINVGTLSKILKQNGQNIGEHGIYEWLRANRYVIKEPGRSYNRPTQRSMELGIMSVKESTRISASGNTHIDAVTLITGKGQQYFIQKFSKALWLVV